jgi:hypothetical protein
MQSRLEQVHDRLHPLRSALLQHPLYNDLDHIDALRQFMEHHAFAVWDFMSLLKALQQRLCCVTVPWVPTADAHSSRLINAIVLAEETDEDGHGGFISHFGLYHRAMTQCGADTTSIDRLVETLQHGGTVATALSAARAPECVRRFVEQTFSFIEEGDTCTIAAAFTFGREDLLPDLFQRIVNDLNAVTSGNLDDFRYYLNRHIGLDGDEHGPMAAQLIGSLCGASSARWQTVEEVAVTSLKARLALWDGIHDTVRCLRV